MPQMGANERQWGGVADTGLRDGVTCATGGGREPGRYPEMRPLCPFWSLTRRAQDPR